jgi:hypothetical protein
VGDAFWCHLLFLGLTGCGVGGILGYLALMLPRRVR